MGGAVFHGNFSPSFGGYLQAMLQRRRSAGDGIRNQEFLMRPKAEECSMFFCP